MASKTEREIRNALLDTGLNYEIVNGGKHKKIFLNGRLVGIYNGNHNSNPSSRRSRNLMAQINRRADRLHSSSPSA